MGERPVSHLAFKTHQLQLGESIEQAWVAGVPWTQADNFRGRLSKFGGNLVLTNRRLLFEPLTAPKVGGGLKGHDLLFLEGMKAFDFAEIVSVEPFSTKGPPRLKLALANGEEVVLAVMRKRTATAWSKDASARDEAVAAISAVIPGGGSASASSA